MQIFKLLVKENTVNKLAGLALAAFALLGTLMWYAASHSMEQYLAEYQTLVTSKLPTGSKLTLGELQVNSNADEGMLTTLSLTLALPSSKQQVQLVLENIHWQYEKRSLKKEIVQVPLLSVKNTQLTLPKGLEQQALSELTQVINEVAHKNEAENLGLNDRKEFNLNITKLWLENIYVTLSDNNTPVEEVIFNQVSINHSPRNESNEANEARQPMSITASKAILAISKQVQSLLAGANQAL